MKRRYVLISVVPFLMSCQQSITLKAQRNVAKGELNDVLCYIGYPDTLSFGKVVLFIRGTGRFPATQDFGMGAEASLFGYSIVYPQKSYVNDPQKYYEHDSRYQRIHDLVAVIDDLIGRGTQQILILADSEGTMLAPELAKTYKDQVTGLVCMGGSLFPFEKDIEYCVNKKRGVFASIENEDELHASFDSIFARPTNVKKDFMGHSYRFWASYLKYNPLEHINKLSMPVLYLNGENDEIDIPGQKALIEQLRIRGINIGQITYAGVGHELTAVGRKLAEDILGWAKRNGIIEE
ncbi:MAG: alpha/beta hydrolase family protein [Chitinispirillaceae bacterium]